MYTCTCVLLSSILYGCWISPRVFTNCEQGMCIMRLPLKHIQMPYTRLGEWTHPLVHTCTTDLLCNTHVHVYVGGGSVLCVLGVVGLFETSKGTNHVIGRMTTLTNTFLAPYTLYFYSLCVVWAV